MTDVSNFISELWPINNYRYSRGTSGVSNISLSARNTGGETLTIHGQRSGWLHPKSQGLLTTPLGNVNFQGTQSFVTGEEHVSLSCRDGEEMGQLVLPKFWRTFSCCHRAHLRIGGESPMSFDLWNPSVGSDETVGRFRLGRDKKNLYKLFSSTVSEKMFQDVAIFTQMQDSQALILLTGLLYYCLYPGWVTDGE